MATVTITIPDTEVDRTLDGFTAHHKYSLTVANPDYDPVVDDESLATIPNPESKVQFVKREIVEFVKASVKAEETRSTLEAARGAMPSEPDIT